MTKLVQHSRSFAFFMLIGISAVVGWCMPDFLEWTGSRQSRPSPLVWQVPIGAGVAALAICCVLPWLPIGWQTQQTRPPLTLRFGVRSLLILTTAIAVAIPLFTKFPTIAGWMVWALAIVNLVRVVMRDANLLYPAIGLLACMFLPYLWVVHYEERDRILVHFLIMIPELPTLFPAAWLGGMFGMHFQDTPWIAMLLTAIELVVGTWIICLGPKRSIACSLIALWMSAVGSLAFYQLCIF